MTGSHPLRATDLLACFTGEEVTHIVGLPDNDTAALFDALAGRDDIALVRVTREGEAFAIASGLWLGGAVPVVVIQNTGLLESGDALRGTASRMGVPLVILVGCRGFAKMAAAGRDPRAGDPSREDLVRADLDSAALMTEPTLRAWGVPFSHLSGATDLPAVAGAFGRTRTEERPVALLLTARLA